ncbi:Host attachment protein [Halomonas sp. NYA30]
MKMTGVLVSDQTSARLFTINLPKAPFEELARLANPEGRLHERDIEADRPGRAFDSMGRGRHAMGTRHPATEQQEIRFAQEIATLLADHHRRDSFQRLVLCAPPKLLGLIREALPKRVAGCLLLELDKDLAHLSDTDLRAHLTEYLPTIIQPQSSLSA